MLHYFGSHFNGCTLYKLKQLYVMHDEQYDFQMFACNACQISVGKQNKPLKVAVCSLEEPHVVTSEPQNISCFLCMMRAVESVPYSVLYFLESGCSNDQMYASAKCNWRLIHVQTSELICAFFFLMAYLILT